MLVYLTSFYGWFQEISGSVQIMVLVVGGLTLVGYGFFLKRKIFAAFLERPKTNFAWGLSTLAVSVSLYLVGTFYAEPSFFGFQSLIFLVISYLSFRLDTRLTKQALPLITILALTLSVPLASVLMGRVVSYIFIAFLMLGLFAFFVDTNPHGLLLPIIGAAFEIATLLAPDSLLVNEGIYLVLSVPISFALPLVLPRLRRQLELPLADSPNCEHRHPVAVLDELGFCLMCGTKVRPSRYSTDLSLTGFLVIFVIVLLLLIIQIPLIAISGGQPRSEVAQFSGLKVSPIPVTPLGWFVNSTKVLNESGDSYALNEVIAPIYHPERANYTLYYEISATGSNPTIAESWGPIPGWTETHSLQTLGPLGGTLLTYTSSSTTMIIYEGAATMTFLNPGGSSFFATSRVGLSIMRTFQGTNVTNATAIFLNDSQQLFVPSLEQQSIESDWVSYFNEINLMLKSIGTFILTAVTSSLLVFSTYYLKSTDSKRDSLIREASDLDQDSWALYSFLVNDPKIDRTTIEIAELLQSDERKKLGNDVVLDLLQGLEDKRLVKRVLSIRQGDIVLTWRSVP